MKVLLVEDDAAMRETLERTLARRGMTLASCDDGRKALALWRSTEPDAVLLDLTLPGLDGLEVLAQARASGLRTPVLLLTARGTVGDRVLGLNAGADDYLPKPFDLDELEARLKALVRRHAGASAPATSRFVEFGDLRLDPESGAVYRRDSVLELTPREAAFLQALLARPGQAVGKERLFNAVFPGEPEVNPEAVEVVAYRLRKKLAATRVTVVTLRGLGYLAKAT
ncbi:response regulator transcription factor [Ramlibacter sp.]|uniref:response regulator transcription factor n=1 Tax=Ramlibacter sp. TaxID=1917967 RepID=UPI003D11B55C